MIQREIITQIHMKQIARSQTRLTLARKQLKDQEEGYHQSQWCCTHPMDQTFVGFLAAWAHHPRQSCRHVQPIRRNQHVITSKIQDTIDPPNIRIPFHMLTTIITLSWNHLLEINTQKMSYRKAQLRRTEPTWSWQQGKQNSYLNHYQERL